VQSKKYEIPCYVIYSSGPKLSSKLFSHLPSTCVVPVRNPVSNPCKMRGKIIVGLFSLLGFYEGSNETGHAVAQLVEGMLQARRSSV
jgi:hypothetical protein